MLWTSWRTSNGNRLKTSRAPESPRPEAKQPLASSPAPFGLHTGSIYAISNIGWLSKPRICPKNFYDPRNINKSQELS